MNWKNMFYIISAFHLIWKWLHVPILLNDTDDDDDDDDDYYDK